MNTALTAVFFGGKYDARVRYQISLKGRIAEMTKRKVGVREITDPAFTKGLFALSEKKLTRLRMKALKEVAEAHEFIRKHKGEIKQKQAKSRKAKLLLETINRVRLEKAGQEIDRASIEATAASLANNPWSDAREERNLIIDLELRGRR